MSKSYSFNPIWRGVRNIQLGVGGGIERPPMFSLKLTFLGPKNDKAIYPHIFEDLMEGSELKHPPLAPKNSNFCDTSKNAENLKFSKK